MHYQRWKQTSRRGPVRAHLITANLRKRGVSLDYASRRYVPDRARSAGWSGGSGPSPASTAGSSTSTTPERRSAPAWTGSAASWTRPATRWRNAFYITRGGAARIGAMQLSATVDQYPQMDVTNVNSPTVKGGGIGVYAPDWGQTYGYRITDGQTKAVRMVVIRSGRVIANRTSSTRAS